MTNIKFQFDYQSIIEIYGIQDVNTRKALEEKSEVSTKFYEQFTIFKNLSNERDEKNENLMKQKHTLDQNLRETNRISEKLSTLNKMQIVQEEISHLNLELLQQSDDFVNKMSDMDNELKALYSQFEGETLTNLLSDVNTELLSVQDTEAQLERTLKELQRTPMNLSAYERPKILKEVFKELYEFKDIEEINKKLANKKRNIEFLTAEYNKKMELLQRSHKSKFFSC